MKDKKSILLLIVSSLLFIVSFALLWTWGYRFYMKKQEPELKAGVTVPVAPSPNHTRDSLQIIYTDSVKDELSKKLEEYYQLRNEIDRLLKDKNSDANFQLAKQKIAVLKVMANSKPLDVVIPKNDIIEIPERPGQALSISDISLAAIAIENEREQETSQSQKAEKFVGSFMIKANTDQKDVSEVMVIVLQPDGQVVKNSAWESGTFQTNEGKRVYSYKLRFDNNREPKKLLFSLTPERYLKGSYTMQVYFNGMLLGKTTRTLS